MSSPGAPPSVLILGTGALASFVGARLSRSGATRGVTLAGTWAPALQAIASRGIHVEEPGGAWNAPAEAVEISGPLPVSDLVLVLVKSWQTAAVAPHAARGVAPGGLVLTLQNGLGHVEILEAAVGVERVAAGVTTVGARLLGPGMVEVHGPRGVVLGVRPRTPAPLADAARLFAASGFDTEVSPDLDRVLWRKLAVNCAINPLSALLGVPNGALLDSPEARERLEAAAREVGAVAHARGIDLGLDPAGLALDVARRTGPNRSSMLQDLDRGAPTEVEALNGAVVREGARLRVPTPVNAWLLEQMRGRTGPPRALGVEAHAR